MKSKKQQTLATLDVHFAPFGLDIADFVKTYKLEGTQPRRFLSYLQYGFYYNEIHLQDFSKQDQEYYLLVLLAEILDENELRQVLSLFTTETTLRLIAHCANHPREGSWAIFEVLERQYKNNKQWQTFIILVRRKYYSAHDLYQLVYTATDNLTLDQLIFQLDKLAFSQIKEIQSILTALINAIIESPAQGAFHALDGEAKQKIAQSREHLEQLFSLYRHSDYTLDQLRDFFMLFGLYGHYLGTDLANIDPQNSPLSELLKNLLVQFQNPQSIHLNQVGIILSFVLSLCQNLDVFHHHPQRYITGLSRLIYTMSTKKSLVQYPQWLVSTLGGLETLIQHLYRQGVKFSMAECPIILFDQSPQAQFKQNRQVIKHLLKRYPAHIWHISRTETLQLANQLDVDHWIRTNPKGPFGYGGARNCAFLLAPVIQRAMQQGKQSMAEIMQMPEEELRSLYNEATLGQTQHDSILYLGEDDIAIPACNFFSDAIDAANYQEYYFQRHSYTVGRATHGIKVPHLQDIIKDPSSLFSSTYWHNIPESGGMKGMLTKPVFCLPLPFGFEERHVITPASMRAPFQQPIQHLAGTRFPKAVFPTTPLDGIMPYLKDFLFYSFEISMVSTLISPSKLNRCILPWNRLALQGQAGNTHCLQDLLNYANDCKTQKELKDRFWQNMNWVFLKNNLEKAPLRSHLDRFADFTPVVDAPKEVIDFYASLEKDAKCCLAFGSLCCQYYQQGIQNSIQKAKKEVEATFHTKIAKMPLTQRMLELTKTFIM